VCALLSTPPQADKLRGIVQFGAVDCSEDKDFCIQAGVSSLPGVKLFPWQPLRNPYKPRAPPAKIAVDFSGARSARALSDFVTSQLPREFIHNLTSAAPDWRDHVTPPDSAPPLVLLFTDKEASTALYRSLSLRFRGRLRFAQARAADAELAAAFGVTAAPSLVVQLASGDRVTYDGKLKADALTAFLEQHAAAAPPPGADEQQPAGMANEAAASPASPLVLHNASQLSSAVLAKEPAALVGFLAGSPDACATEWDAWRAAARMLEGQVIAAECDATADWAAPYVRAQGDRACVTVARFPFGAADKADADVELYEGAMDGRALGAWALESLPDFVRQITAANAEAYFSLDARAPKLILITSKTETPLMFRTLAANYHGHVQFAVTHSSDPLAARLKVERVPAVKAMLVPPGAVPGPDGAMPLMLQDYPGPLRYEHLSGFCAALAEHAAGSDAGSDVQATGPAEVVALTDDEALRDVCEKRGALCVLAFLDSRAQSLPSQLDILQASAARQGLGAPVQFAWVDASRHASAAAAFDIATAPAAVVLSARKLRYAPLRTAYSTDALSDLVNAVLAGRATTAPLAALPRLVAEEVAPAAAEEEAAPAEEEFDLSEIMDVDVETTSREEQLRQAEASVRADQEARAAAAQAAQAAEAADKAKAAKAKHKKKSKAKKRAVAANAEL
jgi:protein disulfide-isomerase A6